MRALVAICIMLAIALLTVNIYFRNHKFIKMSSPNVNNLIILGSIMTYCSVILLGIDTNMVSELDYSRMCTVRIRNLDPLLWIHTRIRLNVCQNVAGSFHLQRHPFAQKGNQRLQIVLDCRRPVADRRAHPEHLAHHRSYANGCQTTADRSNTSK
ncbi:gamma-aminobutyric acid type B receptor subunit 2 protein [Trichinella spiralis]|uniref:gamma-aminobutyric acid type B receptor subunit 2 protein n=1 Tax=Trichinella spiralis TaxID=6334 RepID=UPI0001EFD67B|nr:gamma-aminobutyric acid type B receptor subunit 2 protein [Trichinella spiralis]